MQNRKRVEVRPHLPFSQIEARVITLAARQTGMKPDKVHSYSRVVQDLHCDSLDFVELMMAVEEEFGVTLPPEGDVSAKILFTRREFRVTDLAELVYLNQGRATALRPRSFRKPQRIPIGELAFTQLDGRAFPVADAPNFDAMGQNEQGYSLFHRRVDGMVCVLIPGSTNVVIGADSENAEFDQSPAHTVQLDRYLIDQETVSTSAYSRFLNSIIGADEAMLREWFILNDDDHRATHVQLQNRDGLWFPRAGVERQPMVLVSWFGTNAYAIWANGADWRAYRSDRLSFLPTEAQWEHAAAGAEREAQSVVTAAHMRGEEYTFDSLPMSDVNVRSAVSNFGVNQMAGNVWQWCRDWYSPEFYKSADSSAVNPVNREPTGMRSERGGSWVGPASLCACTYRRGRDPIARGRCLGFRCVSDPEEARGATLHR